MSSLLSLYRQMFWFITRMRSGKFPGYSQSNLSPESPQSSTEKESKLTNPNLYQGGDALKRDAIRYFVMCLHMENDVKRLTPSYTWNDSSFCIGKFYSHIELYRNLPELWYTDMEEVGKIWDNPELRLLLPVPTFSYIIYKNSG